MTNVRGAVCGLWGSSHPGPTVVVTALAAALSVAVELELWRTMLLAVAVFVGQLSIGISNDAIDAERDRAVGRRDKPLARGDITARTAWVAALGCLGLALMLSAPLGVGMFTAHALALISAWSYNAGLKATPWSIVPFFVTFGVFPSLVTLSAPQPELAAPWAWLAGGSLGAAVHLTNVLPDLDDDERTGIQGLPHRIGGRSSVWLAAAAVLAGALAATLGPVGGQLTEVTVVVWLFFGAVVAVAAVTVVLASLGRPGRALFRLVMLSALLLAIQLVISGGSLAG